MQFLVHEQGDNEFDAVGTLLIQILYPQVSRQQPNSRAYPQFRESSEFTIDIETKAGNPHPAPSTENIVRFSCRQTATVCTLMRMCKTLFTNSLQPSVSTVIEMHLRTLSHDNMLTKLICSSRMAEKHFTFFRPSKAESPSEAERDCLDELFAYCKVQSFHVNSCHLPSGARVRAENGPGRPRVGPCSRNLGPSRFVSSRSCCVSRSMPRVAFSLCLVMKFSGMFPET
jgi:hypothetical protein